MNRRISRRELSLWGRKQLQGKSDSAALDVRLLLCHTLQIDELVLFREPQEAVSEAEATHFRELILRRESGEPVAYLLGHQAFYGAEFVVTPATLIPRPDTELLIDITLEQLPAEQSLSLVDLGTGSGVIAITLARLRPNWQLLATDCSAEALAVARQNAERQQVTNIRFQQANWLVGIHEAFDAILSNPPYIAAGDPHLTDLHYEPASALVADDNGMADYQALIPQAKERLKPNGLLAVEHGATQATALNHLLVNAGYCHIHCYNDLANLPRLTTALKPKT